MASTRISDYAAIGSGGAGISNRNQLSRQLARGPLPGGKEEKDTNSTPVVFDVDGSNGGKVEVNGECKGNGNSDGLVDNKEDNNNYNVNDHNGGNDGGGAG